MNDTGSAATGYTDGSVAAGTPYTYRIKAINAHGSSWRSRWLHIDTPSAPVPDKPTGLTAAAAHDQVVLTWDDPQDDSITGYVILRRNRDTDAQGQFTELVADTGSAATGYTDGSVAAGTPYTYRIKAINAHGVSERSRWFHIDTLAAPEPEPTPEPEPESAQGQSTPGAGQRENVSEGGTDLPADTTTTGEVDVGGSVTGNIDFGGDGDWFRVALEAGKRYQIDVEGAPTGRGTLTDSLVFRINDADGVWIRNTGDDDSGVGDNARKIFSPSADGAYFVWAASGTTGLTGTYTLSVIYLGANGASEADTDLPADAATTGVVDVGGSVTGNIDPTSDKDLFRVELVANKTYQIDLEGATNSRGTLRDPYLYGVHDASRLFIPGTENDDNREGGVDSRLIFTPDTGGTHFLVAGAYDSGVSGDENTGTYTLSVRDISPPPVTPPLPAVVEGGTDLAGNATTRAVIEAGGFVARGAIAAPVRVSGNYYRFDKDWFQVTLQAGRTYRFDLAPVIRVRGDGTYEVSLYPEIVALYDADSDYLQDTSDRESSGPGYVARVEVHADAGRRLLHLGRQPWLHGRRVRVDGQRHHGRTGPAHRRPPHHREGVDRGRGRGQDRFRAGRRLVQGHARGRHPIPDRPGGTGDGPGEFGRPVAARDLRCGRQRDSRQPERQRRPRQQQPAVLHAQCARLLLRGGQRQGLSRGHLHAVSATGQLMACDLGRGERSAGGAAVTTRTSTLRKHWLTPAPRPGITDTENRRIDMSGKASCERLAWFVRVVVKTEA